MNDVIEFYPQERAVKTISVELTNFNAVRLDFGTSFGESEEDLRAAMDILIEAACLIREQIGAFRLRNAMKKHFTDGMQE